MKKLLLLLLAAVMILSAVTSCSSDSGNGDNASAETTAVPVDSTPKFIYKRVVILGVDGMGAFPKDADTPNMDRIFKDGATTYSARTSVPSISGQCWGSLLTGASASAHGLTNSIVEANAYSNEALPTIFKRVRDAMPDALLASYCHWEPVNSGIIEDDIDVVKVNGEDAEIYDDIATYLTENDPTLFYSHFDSPDGAGHGNGYGSKKHLAQISAVDGYIGAIYDALEKAGKLEDTLLIVATDHGGTPDSPGSHGGYSDAEMNIFFGAVGKSVKKGSTIGEMNIRDIAAIALYALGIDVPAFDINGFSAQIPDGLFEGYTAQRQPIYASESTFETLKTPAKDGGKYITDFIDADKVSSVFHFNNNVTDALGNANAEEQYSPKYYSAGYFDNCIEVGEQGSVLLPDAVASEGSYAISFWFKHDLTSPYVAFFGSHPVASTQKLGMSVLYKGSFLTASIGNGHSSQDIDISIPETAPQDWNNLTIVYDRDQQLISCYLNFELVRSTSYSNRFATADFANSAQLVFGSDPTECNDINVMLDELVIFKAALSEDEVAKLGEYYSYSK